jgi:hypothetical protein
MRRSLNMDDMVRRDRRRYIGRKEPIALADPLAD